MRIEATPANCKASAQQVYSHLMQMENIKSLLPQDKISDWQSDENSCSFKVQNMAKIPLVRKEDIPGESIVFDSGEGAPFPFTLKVAFSENEDQSTVASLVFEGKVNPFLEMMVKKPLGNLFDYMADRLVKEFE